MISLGHEAHVALAERIILPPDLRQVWRWFSHIHTMREISRVTEPRQMPDGRLGWQTKAYANRVAPGLIEAWARLSGVEIEPWQFAALQIIDEFFVKTKNDPPPIAVAATAENLLTMLRFLGMKAKKQ